MAGDACPTGELQMKIMKQRNYFNTKTIIPASFATCIDGIGFSQRIMSKYATVRRANRLAAFVFLKLFTAAGTQHKTVNIYRQEVVNKSFMINVALCLKIINRLEQMVEKALIKVLEGPQKDEEIEVMYNPTDYSVSTKVNITGEGGSLQFNKTGMETFTISLFYDTCEMKGDVRTETNRIVSLTAPVVGLKETKRPPYCLFVWGGFSYSGIISDATQKFTMFLETGIPVRAEVTITLKRVESIEEALKQKGKEACRKLWIVKSGDRLDLVAHRALKDPSQWRKIATANNINAPLTFPTVEDVGITLTIPD